MDKNERDQEFLRRMDALTATYQKQKSQSMESLSPRDQYQVLLGEEIVQKNRLDNEALSQEGDIKRGEQMLKYSKDPYRDAMEKLPTVFEYDSPGAAYQEDRKGYGIDVGKQALERFTNPTLNQRQERSKFGIDETKHRTNDPSPEHSQGDGDQLRAEQEAYWLRQQQNRERER